jgi:uncharacterized protein YprB with RNaseH-like and TPR domain
MTRRCIHDGCCEFEQSTHNHVYCVACKCKRKAENAKKRLTAELSVYDTEAWQLEENRKLARAERSNAKSRWLLDNKTFCFFDLETTNLDANYGHILCSSIRDRQTGETLTHDTVSSDTEILAQIRETLEQYDYVVTFFGTRFDIPYLNTRLLMAGMKPVGLTRHVDMYYTARHMLRLNSNRMTVVEESLFGKTIKTRLNGQIWIDAAQRFHCECGARNEKAEAAMEYIKDHCIKDVKSLQDIFEELVRFRKLGETPVRLFR